MTYHLFACCYDLEEMPLDEKKAVLVFFRRYAEMFLDNVWSVLTDQQHKNSRWSFSQAGPVVLAELPLFS
jgi:hypothetical protein